MSPHVPWVSSQRCLPRCGSHTASGEGLLTAHVKYSHKLIGIYVVLSSQFFTVYSFEIFLKAQITPLFRVSCLAVSDSALPQIVLFCLQLSQQAVCSCECTQGAQQNEKMTEIISLRILIPKQGSSLYKQLLKPTGQRSRHWFFALSLLQAGLSLQTQDKGRTEGHNHLHRVLASRGLWLSGLLPLPEALAPGFIPSQVFVPVVFQLVPVHQAYLDGPWLWKTAGWGICSFAFVCWKKNCMALRGFNLLDVCFCVS